MLFYSTKRQSTPVRFRDALFLGQAADGGLYMPEQIPKITITDLEAWQQLSYAELAYHLSRLWIGDEVDDAVLHEAMVKAYDWPLPLHHISAPLHVTELWHGPTLAFKDFAARWLGQLVGRLKGEEPLTILVATSGDTGSAVAAGFFGVPGVRVIILYPSGRVSHLQEQQLTTFGGNVTAVEVRGSFDDCQRLVKQVFADKELRTRVRMTSANSINIGRLLPQTFYYIWSYLRAVEHIGDYVDFCVPSGNVGNLTAGLIAKRMGLPVQQFVSAVNRNTPFTEFLSTGAYNPQPSIATLSNAMDVGNPSNIFRIFDLYAKIKSAPASPENVDLHMLQKDLWGTSVDDDTTRSTMKKVYANHHYIMDPHTAVGWAAIEGYRKEYGADVPMILMSTAHPAKFLEIVEGVVGKDRIQIPSQLAHAAQQKKQSTIIDASFECLKSIITSAS